MSCYKSISTFNELNALINSAEHISYSDTLDKKIMIKQEWNLLPNKGIHSCIAPSVHTAKFGGGYCPFPKFPE